MTSGAGGLGAIILSVKRDGLEGFLDAGIYATSYDHWDCYDLYILVFFFLLWFGGVVVVLFPLFFLFFSLCVRDAHWYLLVCRLMFFVGFFPFLCFLSSLFMVVLWCGIEKVIKEMYIGL